jgi:hypothetical protein
MAGLRAQIDGMKLVGLLDGPFDVEKLIDRRFLPDDLKA